MFVPNNRGCFESLNWLKPKKRPYWRENWMVRKIPFAMGSQMGIMRLDDDDMAFLNVCLFSAP